MTKEEMLADSLRRGALTQPGVGPNGSVIDNRSSVEDFQGGEGAIAPKNSIYMGGKWVMPGQGAAKTWDPETDEFGQGSHLEGGSVPGSQGPMQLEVGGKPTPISDGPESHSPMGPMSSGDEYSSYLRAGGTLSQPAWIDAGRPER